MPVDVLTLPPSSINTKWKEPYASASLNAKLVGTSPIPTRPSCVSTRTIKLVATVFEPRAVANVVRIGRTIFSKLIFAILLTNKV